MISGDSIKKRTTFFTVLRLRLSPRESMCRVKKDWKGLNRKVEKKNKKVCKEWRKRVTLPLPQV